MAMTAWSAKVWSRAIWPSEKARGSGRPTVMAPIGIPSRSIGTDTMAPQPVSRELRMRVLGIAGQIRAIRHGARQDGPAGHGTPAGREREHLAHDIDVRGCHVVRGRHMDQPSIETKERAAGRLAEPDRILDDGVEDRLDIGARGRDDPKDLARGLLLLQGVGEVASQVLVGRLAQGTLEWTRERRATLQAELCVRWTVPLASRTPHAAPPRGSRPVERNGDAAAINAPGEVDGQPQRPAGAAPRHWFGHGDHDEATARHDSR